MDVESLKTYLILQDMTDEQQETILSSVRAANEKAKQLKKERISQNVGLVVDALKKIEADIRARYDDLGNKIETRVNSIQDGRDGSDGRDGKDGKDGRPGRDGLPGPMGPPGRDGLDGVDGEDGVSVIDAKIDFDGSLVISLSNGREINVGEVVAPDLAERIKVITNGGGTSQSVLDTLASLQTQINNLIPSQTGNAGKYLTTNGSALSWASVIGVLSYQGTWDASTNTPTLTSSVGTNGYYYVVSTAGSTNLNGITDWQVGDWLIFNGTAWQKLDQTDLVTSVNGQTGAVTITAAGLGALTSVASADASVTISTVGTAVDLAVYSSPRLIMQVRNETGSTLTKGTVVYINGASGNKATVTKAIATGDPTSAQTLGLIAADLSTNNNGTVILVGEIAGLDTSAFAAGAQLYLSSSTAGAYTSTKQYAPNHLVYVGVVTRSHATQGTIEVRIQNGYEMEELHNVSAQNPSNGQVLIYNASTSLWEKNTLTDGTGITITEGAGSITITNSAPDQTVALTGAGTTSISGTYPNFTITSNDQYVGTVTSVGGTGTVNGISLSGTVTSSGSLTLSGTLSNIGNSSLTNSSVTIGSTSVSLGSTATTVSGLTLSSPTISGGTVNNASVGATTPSTGAFTTLSATGVTTVQAGTAAAPAITTSGDTNTGVFFPAADTVAIGTGGTEALRVDSARNMGLGVTPNTWSSSQSVLQFGTTGRIAFSSIANSISSNAYNNSGWKYVGTGNALLYAQDTGSHIWYNAASGTAGNAITWTQVMAVEGSKSLALEGATSQSGTGITFPATQSASSNANTLDDYEEGTFTATLTPGTSGSITLNSIYDLLSYTKIGRLVTITGQLVVSSVSSPVGSLVNLNNLPFPCADTSELSERAGGCTTYVDDSANLFYTQGMLLAASDTFTRIYMSESGRVAAIAANDAFVFSFSYITS